MRAKRVILLCAAIASVFLCLLSFYSFVWAIKGTVPHASASGERLSFAAFRSNEFIIVKSAHGDRGVRHREYRFYWSGGARYVDVAGNVDSMDYGTTSVSLVSGRALTDEEVGGIDWVVRWFRRTGEQPSFAGTERYELDYFRDNQPIGREVFIGYRLTEWLAYFASDGMRGKREFEADYDRLALKNGITRAELDRFFPFEYLEPERTNSR